jgi:hypothetical protein
VGWAEQADAISKLAKGDIVVLTNCYVKEGYRGGVEVHLNDRSEITINPDGISVSVKDPTAKRKKMEDIDKSDDLVEVFGTIVQVYDQYFYEADAQTGRKVTGSTENIETEFRGILNVFVDDGTRSLKAVFFNDQFKRLTQVPLDEIREDAEKREALKQELLGAFISITGRVRYSDQYERLDVNVDQFTLNPDPEEEIAKLEQAE